MAFKEKKKAHDKADSELARRFKTSPLLFIGTFIVLIIVIVAFVLVPAIVPNSRFGRDVDLTFGYYDKIPISYVPPSVMCRGISLPNIMKWWSATGRIT